MAGDKIPGRRMRLALIAAIARNRVIGKDNSLPWRIPEDMKRFKRLTMGHTILMGRKTFESLGKPLSGRRNLVVTSVPISNVECFSSPADALKAAQAEEWIFVIGGAAMFQFFIDRCDALYLTFVDQEPEGNVLFPPYEHLLGTRYIVDRQESHEGYQFVDYIARAQPGAAQ